MRWNLDSHKKFRKSNKGRVDIIIKAELKVTKSYKGSYKVGEIIIFEWKDLYDSMCPHAKTAIVLRNKEAVWYSKEGHNKKNVNLAALNKKFIKRIEPHIKIEQAAPLKDNKQLKKQKQLDSGEPQ